jgi:hypothetical protein
MAWLKTVGCDCDDCGPDACTPACDCLLSYFDSGTSDWSDVIDLVGQFIPGNELMINYQLGATDEPGCNGQVLVWVDGDLIFDSGCVSGNLDPTGYVIAFPAGAAVLEYEVTVDCTPGYCSSPAWSFSAQCID